MMILYGLLQAVITIAVYLALNILGLIAIQRLFGALFRK
jgi:hypothetical protein